MISVSAGSLFTCIDEDSEDSGSDDDDGEEGDDDNIAITRDADVNDKIIQDVSGNLDGDEDDGNNGISTEKASRAPLHIFFGDAVQLCTSNPGTIEWIADSRARNRCISRSI